VLIDVREDLEWQKGHLPQAMHIGKGVIERDIEGKVQDKQQTLVLYCGGGFRSALAADALQQMGYSDVLSLAGGYTAWVNAGLPVTQD
jgi:rhodanese-related sulfurtransferase